MKNKKIWIIFIVIVLEAYSLGSSTREGATVASSKVIITPTPTKTALQEVNEVLSEAPTSEPLQTTENWKPYTKDSQNITENNFGFTLGYPAGWLVNYQTASSSIEFDFAPPGWVAPAQSVGFMGYATMTVTRKPHYNTIDEYIQNEYGQFYQGKIEGIQSTNIGNEVSYLIQSKSDSDPIFQAGWDPRYVVLGTNNSYEINFGNGGAGGSSLIKNTIWPFLRFD
jgi:hypothetical protein